jgi:hypothetical protein
MRHSTSTLISNWFRILDGPIRHFKKSIKKIYFSELELQPKKLSRTTPTEEYATIRQTTELSQEPEIQMQSGDRENVAGSYYVEDLTESTPKQFVFGSGVCLISKSVVLVSALVFNYVVVAA